MDSHFNATNTTSTTVSHGPSSSSQPFSRANVFSMFVTLQLCQLTQPYGSLLFQGASGFLWRCNPISSFVESCIIAVELVRSFWGSGRKCPSASDYCYSKMDVVETSRGRLVGRSQKCMGRAYTSISIGVDNMTGCPPNRAIEFSLPIVPTAFYPFCASSK
jgi:hypothetical protein